MRADEIFLTSSARGFLPVRELAGLAQRLQAHWRALGPMRGAAA